jgi:hypothetical protein
MAINLKCDEETRVYKNRSKKDRTVTVSVQVRCELGGGPLVRLIDTKDKEIEDTEQLPAAGGTVTYDVPPKHKITVNCGGGNGDGCTVDVTVQ